MTIGMASPWDNVIYIFWNNTSPGGRGDHHLQPSECLWFRRSCTLHRALRADRYITLIRSTPFENEHCIVLKVSNLIVTNIYLPSYKVVGTENRPGKENSHDTLDLITGIFDKFKDHVIVCARNFNCAPDLNEHKTRQFV